MIFDERTSNPRYAGFWLISWFFSYGRGSPGHTEDSIIWRAGLQAMARYKIDGAKFQSVEELKEGLWPLYEGKMTREEFEKYVEERMEVVE
jgi:hypothetical protein